MHCGGRWATGACAAGGWSVGGGRQVAGCGRLAARRSECVAGAWAAGGWRQPAGRGRLAHGGGRRATGGELQQADARAARNGHAWYELDVTYAIIRLMGKLGLASDIVPVRSGLQPIR